MDTYCTLYIYSFNFNIKQRIVFNSLKNRGSYKLQNNLNLKAENGLVMILCLFYKNVESLLTYPTTSFFNNFIKNALQNQSKELVTLRETFFARLV